MDIREYSKRVHSELSRNILPFWANLAIDNVNGGFWGKMTFDGHVLAKAPKSLVLNAQILWVFSSICQYEKKDIFFPLAKRAFDFITSKFMDTKYGGAFWMLNCKGEPLDTRKEVFGQAALILALIEYYKVSQDARVLQLAEDIFVLLENKCRDNEGGGYLESWKRDWSGTMDSHLCEGFLNEKRSLYTNLQLLEAYTSFCQVWNDGNLYYRLKELMDLFFKYMLDVRSLHFNLLYDLNWRTVSNHWSYGHDIWTSRLWCDSARVLGNKDVMTEIEKIYIKIIDTNIKQGVDHDNGLFCYGNQSGPTDTDKHGWAQAEAALGYLYAYILTRERKYYDASVNSWLFIEKNIVDKVNGEWHWKISQSLEPLNTCPKISTWKSPFFNGRACIEIIRQLYQIQAMHQDQF